VAHPRQLKQRDWDTIRKRAEELVKENGFQYVKASVYAYLEFFCADVENIH
jgi:hypothetical protein